MLSSVSYVSKDESGMTQFLKDVLHKTKGMERKEQLRALKMAWLTHRQIGASETVYRILPGLHLKDSNIACIFVSSGFPENRAALFIKVIEGEKDKEYDDEFEDESDDEG